MSGIDIELVYFIIENLCWVCRTSYTDTSLLSHVSNPSGWVTPPLLVVQEGHEEQGFFSVIYTANDSSPSPTSLPSQDSKGGSHAKILSSRIGRDNTHHMKISYDRAYLLDRGMRFPHVWEHESDLQSMRLGRSVCVSHGEKSDSKSGLSSEDMLEGQMQDNAVTT